MTTTVRAAVQTGPRQIEMREFPRPATGPDDGLLRVEANGICGSDIEIFDRERPPFIPGHEPMGIVEEIGERAAQRWGVQAGDRVALEVVVPCRACHSCLTGRYQACRLRRYGHGVTGIDVDPALWGGFAEYLYLSPTSVLHRIDRSLPAEVAAMYNPLGAGVRWAVDLGGVGLGDTLLVLGAGQRGLAAVVAARAAGAGTIVVTGLESDGHKLALARELGADHTLVVDDGGPELPERVRELTGGAMADVAVDMTPMAGGPIADALASVRFGGTVVLAGLKGHKKIPLVTDQIIQRGLVVKGAFGVDAVANRRAIELLESRRFPFERLHTHTFGLDDVGLAIDTLAGRAGDGTAVHVSVHPHP
ncbi:zinc-binding dehydrogenase [Pseudonocardia sp. NPDC046786]|uniref:zinc-dependent alcohol dehydrogenase n=1 Tax=Pseudonocardia sp. NPDC046786 TaxID=3155471 RepID=UPI0033D506C0